MLLYILDDDITELAFWAETLRVNYPDVTVELFRDCGSFKSCVLSTPPDACVIDMIMPYHPGTEICAWLQTVNTSIKIFINTSLEGDEFEILANSCKAKYMCKSKLSFNERAEVVVNGCKS